MKEMGGDVEEEVEEIIDQNNNQNNKGKKVAEIEEVSKEDIKTEVEGEIVKIKKGRLIDLITEVINPERMTKKGSEFIEANGEEPYLLFEVKTEDRLVKLLVHYSFSKNSNLTLLLQKYGSLRKGSKVTLKYDQETGRYKFAL